MGLRAMVALWSIAATTPEVGTRRRVLALAALLALLWQGFVVQTHVHYRDGPAQWSSGRGDSSGATLAAPRTPDDPPYDCPICRQAAIAGSYLTPSTPPLPIVLAAFAWFTSPLPKPWRGRQRSHAWRSRGPPDALTNRHR